MRTKFVVKTRLQCAGKALQRKHLYDSDEQTSEAENAEAQALTETVVIGQDGFPSPFQAIRLKEI